jgi:hypothetical protein
MTAKGVPRIEARCGKWMRQAKAYCALPESHAGRCRTPEGMAARYARNVVQHAQVAAERQIWIDRYKLEKGCIDCGYAEHPVALDFDHRDPGLKTANISAMMSSSLELILAELDKCVVRCACCHRIRTFYDSAARRGPGADKSGPGRAEI